MHFWVWLALAGGFLIVEILTLSLIFLSFSIAALVGAAAAALWKESPAQWILFSVVAVLTLAFIRPLMRKYLFRKSANSKTGVDALIHADATTTTEITISSGFIRLRDETWTARCDVGSIPESAAVTVVRIDGAVAVVIPKVSTPIS